MKSDAMLACPQCDLLHRTGPTRRGHMRLCRRCGAVLERDGAGSLEKSLALYLAALILAALANAFPLMTLRLHGTLREISIPGCVTILGELGWPWLGAITFLTVLAGPLVQMGGMTLILAQVLRGRQGPWIAHLFRFLEHLRAWAMAEVFVLGLLVSYAKLAGMATVLPGPALFALGGWILVGTLATSSLEPRVLWSAATPEAALGSTPEAPVPPRGGSAKRAALAACATCGWLAKTTQPTPCPRCGAAIHSRKPDSLGRTWAFLLTAAILYLPANALPVTRVVSLGRVHEDTILGGVGYFLRTGSWPLALVILGASIVVPLLKLVLLAWLLLSVQFHWRWAPRGRTWLYRITDAVGRWSMVDIFAITLMVALLPTGKVASVAPRPGAVAFTLMVVATLLAVQSFDPRLIWDSPKPPLATGAKP